MQSARLRISICISTRNRNTEATRNTVNTELNRNLNFYILTLRSFRTLVRAYCYKKEHRDEHWSWCFAIGVPQVLRGV